MTEKGAKKAAAPAEPTAKARDKATADGPEFQTGFEPGDAHWGKDIDPTPNENYTVAGVLAGKPTPETDPKQREKARQWARNED